MSHRTGIVKALAAKMATDMRGNKGYEDPPVGEKGYLFDLEGLVTAKSLFHSDMSEFPQLTVTPGPEYREDHPANFSWSFLTVMIRAFARDEDVEDQLEILIADIETFIYKNYELAYTAKTRNSVGDLIDTDYEVTDIVIDSLSTDEGILKPDGIAEVAVTIRYELQRI